MVEKFSDYEGGGFLSQEGTFKFEITAAELTDSKKGNPMWVFDCKSEAGTTKVYHSIDPKARWSLNNLIKACLNLNTPEKIAAFELDYETIGQDLVGTCFMGKVASEMYTKTVKVPNDDGTFTEGTEEKESFKIKEYSVVE